MGFKLYKKDVIPFEFEGEKITMTVQRMSAKDSMLLAMKSSRMQSKLASDDQAIVDQAQEDMLQIHLDMMSSIITDITGIEDVEVWPNTEDERKEILNASFDFLMATVKAYNSSGEVAKSEEGK